MLQRDFKGDVVKKGNVITLKIDSNRFPFTGEGKAEGKTVHIKNSLKGQLVEAKITKFSKGIAIGKTLKVLEGSDLESESGCVHFPECGGCLLQNVPYKKQLEMMEEQLLMLLEEEGISGHEYLGMIGSELETRYRNKMEYTFGNPLMGEPMELGLHRRGRFTDVLGTYECVIAPSDFGIIQKSTRDFFFDKDIPFYHKGSHEGYLRHLIVRKGFRTNELLIVLDTSSQMDYDLTEYVNMLLNLELDGNIVGVVHSTNDNLADAFISDKVETLYGRDHYFEEISGLRFKVTYNSFFQTNPIGAERLYEEAINMLPDISGKTVFDLFSGTGTIAQIMAKKAKKVVGIELIEEAVASARVNAELNGIDNAEFIAGDVFKVLDGLEIKPDVIVVDPPRMGMTEKTVDKVASYGVKTIVYVSCNPRTLVDNVKQLEKLGYKMKELIFKDMFPGTRHVETVCLLSQTENK